MNLIINLITGNFNTIIGNIVVKDMIDLSKFDISTLVITKSSHEFVTKNFRWKQSRIYELNPPRTKILKKTLRTLR